MATTISYPAREDFATLDDYTAAMIATFLASDVARNAREAYVARELGVDRRTARAALKIAGRW